MLGNSNNELSRRVVLTQGVLVSTLTSRPDSFEGARIDTIQSSAHDDAVGQLELAAEDDQYQCVHDFCVPTSRFSPRRRRLRRTIDRVGAAAINCQSLMPFSGSAKKSVVGVTEETRVMLEGADLVEADEEFEEDDGRPDDYRE